MNGYIILNKFITQEKLKTTESEDGKYIVISGGKINKTYKKINGIKYNLEKIDKGYILSINIPNKYTKKICNLLENNYKLYECHFKAKMIETLIDSCIYCNSHEDIQKNILNVENYLESNDLYTYNKKVYLKCTESSYHYENNVLYPMNVCLEKINISGGIIIDRSSKWIESLSNQDKNLILKVDKEVYTSDMTIDILNIENGYTNKYNEINNKNYDRIFFDCSGIDNLDKLTSVLNKHKIFCNKIKGKRWVIISELPNIRDIILDLIDFLCDKTINYPIIENGDIKYLNGIILNVDNKKKYYTKANIIRHKINFNECEKYILHNLPKNLSYDIIDELYMVDSQIKISEFECPICTDIINEKLICKTICGHMYCIKCLILSLQERNQCPICRCHITINDIKINKFGYSSKIEAIIAQIKKIPKKMKTMIYIKNMTLIKNIYNTLIENCEFSVMLCIGSKQNKMRIINEFNKDINQSIILIQSKDYEFAKYITGIKYIIISDYDYRYVINRVTMGYDFYNNDSDIFLIILEYSSIENNY